MIIEGYSTLLFKKKMLYFLDGEVLAFINSTLEAKFSGSVAKACDMVWAPNDLCIAQYHNDKKWYRAQVLELLDNDEIKVLL